MNDCIFCKIINKEIPTKIVFKNEHVIAFEDLSPVAPVHILIVPKNHFASANDLNEEKDFDYIKEVYKAAKEIATKLNISESGYRIINNCGDDAGQTVKHIHFHLIGGRELGVMVSE